MIRKAVVILLGLAPVLISLSSPLAQGPPGSHQHAEQTVDPCAGVASPSGGPSSSRSPADAGGILDSIQIETSDLKSFETFFGEVLKARLLERRDHPGRDSIREYCYRGVRIVMRLDHAAPRATGWVQINYVVADVGTIQREIEMAIKHSSVGSLSETERDKVVRYRLKPDVHRGGRTASRLEVLGPEGFLIGFNQYKEEVSH